MTEKVPLIAVFDSGVGGLSIFAAIKARLPGARYTYLADNANLPYGTRSEADVLSCTTAATSRLVDDTSPDLLVIACGTVSTVALPMLRARFGIPVVGVVPAIKPAAEVTKSGTIGLLATPATIKRPYTDALISQHASKCRVLRLGSTWLVEAAERKLRGESLSLAEVAAELGAMFEASPSAAESRLDTVVLGCTHFPLLAEEFSRAAPWPVAWVDSSAGVAARVEFLLGDLANELRQEPDVAHQTLAYVTKKGPAEGALRRHLQTLGFSDLEELSLT